MTLIDRMLLRKAECAAIIDALRRDGRADSVRLVETRMQAWADALTEARDAGAGAPPLRDAKIPHIDHDAIDPRELHRALHPVSAPGATSSPVERVAPSATAPDSGHPSLPPLLRPCDTAADAADAPLAKVWTDDRLALLRTLYAQADLTLDDIAARINALPGPPCASVDAMGVKATKLGLTSDRPLAAPGSAAPPALASKPAEDIEEARQMMRAGNIGAKALSEYFGWPLPEAQAIAAEIRAEAAAQGQAA
jgi:hypothetical protein